MQYSFYHPLSGVLTEEGSGMRFPVGNFFLVEHCDEINEALVREQRELMLMKLAAREIPELNREGNTIRWMTEVMDGVLYGRVCVETTDQLTDGVLDKLRDWIKGQRADGFGEVFAQIPINVSEGELTVAFNCQMEDFLYTEDEMKFYMERKFGTQMGGM